MGVNDSTRPSITRPADFDDGDHESSWHDDDPVQNERLIIHMSRGDLFRCYEAFTFYAGTPGERSHDLTRTQAAIMVQWFDALMKLEGEPARLREAARTGDGRTEGQKKYDAEMKKYLEAERVKEAAENEARLRAHIERMVEEELARRGIAVKP